LRLTFENSLPGGIHFSQHNPADLLLWLVAAFLPEGAGNRPPVLARSVGPPRWVAYQFERDGKTEVYLREFDPKSNTLTPASGGEYLVSKGGGTSPRWNPNGNGKELLYLAPDRSIMSVELTGNVNSPLSSSPPKMIFRPLGIERASPAGLAVFSWAISPDGKRFLFPIPVTSTARIHGKRRGGA
jgi:hypothetical protein